MYRIVKQADRCLNYAALRLVHNRRYKLCGGASRLEVPMRGTGLLVVTTEKQQSRCCQRLLVLLATSTRVRQDNLVGRGD